MSGLHFVLARSLPAGVRRLALRDATRTPSDRRKKSEMPQHLGLIPVVVRDYDEAIAFYVGKLGFVLLEDTYHPAQDKR
jgi:hypothetical protein